jgi:hypothetical protein
VTRVGKGAHLWIFNGLSVGVRNSLGIEMPIARGVRMSPELATAAKER